MVAGGMEGAEGSLMDPALDGESTPEFVVGPAQSEAVEGGDGAVPQQQQQQQQPRLRHPPPPIRTNPVPSVSLLQQHPKSAQQVNASGALLRHAAMRETRCVLWLCLVALCAVSVRSIVLFVCVCVAAPM